MATIANLELLETYYEVISRKLLDKFSMGYTKETNSGVFVPSSLNIIHQAFIHLIDTGVIDKNKPFLDAGCGDGRIVALASSLGIPAWGLESDEELVALAKHNLINLKALGVIKESAAIIHRGNFCDDKSYTNIDHQFSDFGTIYNYDNNAGLLASKIAKEAKPKTVYLLYSGDEIKEEFRGLIFMYDLDLVSNSVNTSAALEIPQGFVRVYAKE